MALIDQIEEFQATMDKVMELVEETKASAGKIPDTSISESPALMKAIFDMCADGIKALNDAIGQAEDIQQTLGR
ncbi:hypothetical protein ACE1B6_16150 [Aerosakkonemataceae cyanobacterium BLCC-F154]|uniref:Uncharacterized protein n=1 Tax=Floridaenema fluviatile BLCC-F154 TaxID=3153640 RepID=A0ABV4YD77_9CYAN